MITSKSMFLDFWKIEFEPFKYWSNHYKIYYLIPFIDSETIYGHIQKTVFMSFFGHFK